MPISVTCPECSSTYRVPDDAAGKAIKCKKCGARVPVSAGGDEEAPASAGTGNGDDGAAEGGGKAKTPAKNSRKLIAIIGGALAFVCCCCVSPTGYFGSAWYVGFWPFGGGSSAVTQLSVPGEKTDTLRPTDGKIDLGGKGGLKPARQYLVKLEKGKKYVIDMKANGKAPAGANYDPYLRLLNSKGAEVASNDDAGSLDAQIKYSPPDSGDYTIQATHFMPLPATGMPFTLSIKTE